MNRKKRILVICPHPEDVVPGQRLKYEQYFDSWRNNGFEVTVSPFFSDRMQQILYTKGHTIEKVYHVIAGYCKRFREAIRLPQYDLVYIFLWVTPFGGPFMESLFVKRNPYMVYDIDDAIFMKVKSKNNWYVDFIKGRRKPFFLMKKAKHVIACTPFLTETVAKYNPNVTDISSTINTNTYQPVNNYQNDHELILGWSGSHSTAAFVYLLKDILLTVNQKRKFKLLVMGDPTFTMEGLEVEALEWTREREVPTLQRFDIGLYPLPMDDNWVLGKSGLKALQYMAVGIPVIATAIGANYRIMEDGKTGYLVKTDQDWVEKLLLLMDDAAARKTIGLAGRKNIEDHYSVNVNTPVYLEIINASSKN